jgi:hypothetical protein
MVGSLGCVFGVLILVACGDPQSAALKELSAQGYSLSVPEFLRAARAGDADAVRGFVAAGMEPNLIHEIDFFMLSGRKWLLRLFDLHKPPH